MNKLCDNSKCVHYTEVPKGRENSSIFRVIQNYREIEITRHLYTSRNSTYFLCGTCHNAVQMMMRR